LIEILDERRPDKPYFGRLEELSLLFEDNFTTLLLRQM
jgi:hypothetical protein